MITPVLSPQFCSLNSVIALFVVISLSRILVGVPLDSRATQPLLLLLQELGASLVKNGLVTETSLSGRLAPLRLWLLLYNVISLYRTLILFIVIIRLRNFIVRLGTFLSVMFSRREHFVHRGLRERATAKTRSDTSPRSIPWIFRMLD